MNRLLGLQMLRESAKSEASHNPRGSAKTFSERDLQKKLFAEFATVPCQCLTPGGNMQARRVKHGITLLTALGEKDCDASQA